MPISDIVSLHVCVCCLRASFFLIVRVQVNLRFMTCAALIRSTDAESRGGDEDVLRPSSEGGDGSRYGAGAGAE